MVKLTKRKGFNFFRSYYDVYNELSDKDKIAFMDALLNRQFQGIKPEGLTGMAMFAYISQTNSIDSQVKGYEDKTGNKLTPSQGGTVGGTVGGETTPSLQVQVQEKEKEQYTKESLTIKNWLIWFNKQKEKSTGKAGKFKVLTFTDENNLKKLLNSYNLKDFNYAIVNLFNSEWAKESNMITPSHFLRVENFNKYLNQEHPKEKLVIHAKDYLGI